MSAEVVTKRIVPELNAQCFSRATLKITGVLFASYWVGVLAHIPACYLMIRRFMGEAHGTADFADQVGRIPLITHDILNAYGAEGALIAGSFIALMLGTMFFFCVAPQLVLAFGWFRRWRWIWASFFALVWGTLCYHPRLELTVCVALVLPSLCCFGFTSWAYDRWIYKEVSDKEASNCNARE